MRKIYLHIGCGKTGSSAIQVWLHQNAEKLLLEGIHYPLFGERITNPYKITSGNGVFAVKAIKSEKSYIFFKNLTEKFEGNILLSSESFQILDLKQINEIRSIFDSLNLNPVIVIYLRDIYDILFSSYNQLVKRHLLKKSFKEWILNINSIQQFDVLQRWDSTFDSIKAVHYDTNKNNLDISFLHAIDICNNSFPRMDTKKINRSLTFTELNILRLLNEIYIDRFKIKDGMFSKMISDSFIMSSPEKDTSIYYDENLENYLIKKFSNFIINTNVKYFNGKNVLSIFRHEGKNISSDHKEIDKEYEVATRELFKMINYLDTNKQFSKENFKNNTNSNESVSLVIDFLRDEAVRKEQEDINYSLTLMKAAQALRPCGPVIKQKIIEYEKRLSLDS